MQFKKIQFQTVKKWSKRFFLGFFTWFLIHSLVIISDGLNDEMQPCTIAVVLGNKVNEDGTLSERLEARLNRSIILYRNGRVSQVVVSGGLGREGHYEGDKMAEYLIANDVPEEVISIDNAGNTTQLTASNFAKNYPEIKSVIVVTQYLHIARTKLAFRKVGLENVYGVHCDYFEGRDFISAWHEFLGYYKYLLLH